MPSIIPLVNNHTAYIAIEQIKNKNYPAKNSEYTNGLLLVGINYDKETKQYSCKMERTAL